MNNNKENLYSRQIGAIGKDAMKNISNIVVLLLGLNTTGIEIAKCLCLLGIKKLYIFDPQNIRNRNKFRNFAIDKNNIPSSNKKIDYNSIKYLKSLNNYVTIEIKSFNPKILKEVDVVIHTSFSKVNTPLLLNKLCRMNSCKYIFCPVIGLTGYIFNDFGPNHQIYDIDGEKYKTCYIKSITYKNNKTQIEMDNNGNGEKFVKNDKFTVLNSLNSDVFNILNIDKNNIIIEGIHKFSNKNNLYMQQVKDKIEIKHSSLLEIISKESCFPDISINNDNYKSNLKILNDMHRLCKNPNLFGKIEDFEYIVHTGKFEFPIIGSIIGSIVSNEIIKIGGKYKPISQECIVDYSELYNRKLVYKSCPNNGFDDINTFLSKNTIRFLQSSNIFIAGCGALGCEYLKLLAMLNVSIKKSNITVTDMDYIELSNLNRQFLFNNDDIGKSKSETACNKIKYFNPNINTRPLKLKLEKDTENIFNRNFWESQDIIINALDNVKARQYVDSKCVLYKKPLFESGTLGTKCNGQVIIPYLTKSYSETRDPVESAIPVCTIKNFPFKIEHCIEWSLEFFNSNFKDFIKNLKELHLGIDNFKKYMNTIDNENIIYQKLKIMHLFKNCLENPNLENLYQFSIDIFQIHFIDSIKQILYSFPIDHQDEFGNPFWKGNKLAPKIIDFNDNPILKKFLDVFCKILCRCIGIKYNKIDIKKIKFRDYKPDKNYKIKVNDSDNTKQGYNINLSKKIKKLYNEIEINVYENFTFDIEEFEKDNDLNSHVEFINIASNVRALIYGIEPIDFIDCKLIAGKIVPALSTTTTLITSVVIMELLKYVTKKVEPSIKNIEFKDIFINSGVNLYIQSSPQKSKKIISGQYSDLYGCKIKAIPESFSIWDTLNIVGKKGIFTVIDLLEYVRDEYSIEIDILSVNEEIIHSKYDVNINHKFIDLYNKFGIKKNEYMLLNITSYSKDNIPIISPKLVYTLY